MNALRAAVLLPMLVGIHLAPPGETQRVPPGRPNILFILADDLGQRDLGSYGSTFYETPHLDRLAREGARFTSAYAAAPVCSPTRASLLTGRWPQRTGVTDYIGAIDKPELWKRNTRSLPAPFGDRLALEETTIAETLKREGYATFFAGKWHLGPEGAWPEQQGFDLNHGGIDRGGPYGGKQYFSPYGNPRLPDGPVGEHLPDRLASETVRFIDANRARPFFAFLSFYSVHTPLMARPDLQRKYEDKRQRLGLEAAWGREHARDVRLVQEHAVYAGMVDAMDQAVGKVLDRLDALGLRENTLVIFTSDNGGLSTSEGWPTSNLPLRAGKGWMYEGGLRVPLLVRWPKVTRPEAASTAPSLAPTSSRRCSTPPPRAAPVSKLTASAFCPRSRARRRPSRPCSGTTRTMATRAAPLPPPSGGAAGSSSSGSKMDRSSCSRSRGTAARPASCPGRIRRVPGDCTPN